MWEWQGADNWAWDSVATKQHGLSNEINDVVLGLVSLRRGLSSKSPPKVKERTITLYANSSGPFPIQTKLEIMFQSWVRSLSHREKERGEKNPLNQNKKTLPVVVKEGWCCRVSVMELEKV